MMKGKESLSEGKKRKDVTRDLGDSVTLNLRESKSPVLLPRDKRFAREKGKRKSVHLPEN